MKAFLKFLCLAGLAICVATCAFACGTPTENGKDVLNYDFPDPTYDSETAPRPEFTSEEKKEQKANGKRILAEITEAAKDLTQTSYTIPAGNYGFTASFDYAGVKAAAVLKNIERPDDNPFTINAEGVTFWFETLGLPCANVVRSLYLRECSNLIIKGLTLDTYEADSFEGTITEIDLDFNRIKIKPHNGTMELTSSFINKAKNGSECRIIPLKASGEAIAPFYNITGGWGPGSMWLSNIVKTGEECWLYLKTNDVANITRTDKWKDVYGTNGILEVGDHICLLYGIQMTTLDMCKNITLDHLSCYIAKGGMWENGGYGNHLWKDCYFGPRPGTNQIFGGGDSMAQGLRHGSTYDNCTFSFSSDDPINIHGFWSTVKGKTNKVLYVNGMTASVQKGDIVEAYSSEGELIATMTVEKVGTKSYTYGTKLPDGTSITMTEKVPDCVKDDGVVLRVPSCECDGWAIKNCTFKNTYQRVLVASGSGIIDNCRFYNCGSRIEVSNITETDVYGEGGFIGDVTITNNLFYNTANHPTATVIAAENTQGFETEATGGHLTIKDNVFVSCGRAFKAVRFSEVTIENNIIANSLDTIAPITCFDNQITGMSKNGKETLTGNKFLSTTEESTEDANPTVKISEEFMDKIIRYARLSTVDGKTATEEIRAALN